MVDVVNGCRNGEGAVVMPQHGMPVSVLERAAGQQHRLRRHDAAAHGFVFDRDRFKILSSTHARSDRQRFSV